MSGSLQFTLDKVAELRALLGDADPDLVHDTLEGQTDVFEIMDWLLAKLGDEEGMEEAISSRLKALGERKSACQNRQQRLRDALLACMTATGEKSLRRPEATVTMGNKKQGIQSIDETALPEVFFKVSRAVSRSAINEAMAKGETVPGVMLDNGGVTLTVRRK
ncbi:MAG TPA: siphovirus Gp157 family protein [Gemmataceae bacterium]|nr:siphovirus Gp157 family protein [Gemmataceae bacterium]